GNVQLEQGLEAHTSGKALLELSTRGELKIKSHTGKVVQQNQGGDPLYQRARAEKGLPLAPPQNIIVRTSAQLSAPAPGVPVQITPLPGLVPPATAAAPAPGVPAQAVPPPGTVPPAPVNPVPVLPPAPPRSLQP